MLRSLALSEVYAAVPTRELVEFEPPARPVVSEVPLSPPQDAPRALAALRRLWQVWFAVVESLAHDSRPLISSARYAELYQGLIDSVGLAAGAPGLTAECRDRVRTAVEPWVNLGALRQLDPAARADLLRLCRKLDAELAGGAVERRSRVWFPMACAAVAIVAYFALSWKRVLEAFGGVAS